ncbi:hypothetical protein [Neobacillus sp. SAB-20_R2A]|uniref:hypothetical protein n=1 Tax=Neobacillus sp. SAB-20_R2A TaxID=3120519 RepID=UPI003C6E5B54
MTREERKAALIKEMIAILSHDDVEADTKYTYLRDTAIQKWTDDIRNGEKTKYRGCIYWSAKAIAKYLENIELIKNKSEDAPRNPELGLNHEHVIPKSWLITRIFLDKTKGEPLKDAWQYLDFYLENMTFACVVTKAEHGLINNPPEGGNYSSVMPEEAFGKNTCNPDYHKYWLRYKKAGVKVYQLKWNGEKTKASIEGEINTDIIDWAEPLIPIKQNIYVENQLIYDLDKKIIVFK